jgi:chromosome segregation ATPase
MESIVEAAVQRATSALRRDLEDAQRQIGEANEKIASLEGVDQNVHQTLGAVTQRLTGHSGTQKALDVAITSTKTTFEDFARNEFGALKAQVGSLIQRVPVTEQVIKHGADAAVSAKASSDLAERRSADVVVATNNAKIAQAGASKKLFYGLLATIILGIAQITANTIITLSRGDAIERHVDERLKTTDERLDRALPK